MNVIEARELAKQKLSKERFYHTECVAKAAEYLATKTGFDKEKAVVSAYLHDILKEIPKNDLLQILSVGDIIAKNDLESSSPVWHAFAGGEYVVDSLSLSNDIGDAVRYHTTAKSDMTMLEKIVYLADYISEDRDFRGVVEVRDAAEHSIDKAILLSLRNQICHLAKLGKHINKHSVEAFNYFLKNGVTL